MPVDGEHARTQLRRDLSVAQAVREQFKHLEFSGCQVTQGVSFGCRGGERTLLDQGVLECGLQVQTMPRFEGFCEDQRIELRSDRLEE